MSFSPVNIDSGTQLVFGAHGWEHWALECAGTTRYIFCKVSGGNVRLYRSTDSGATWSVLDDGNFPGTYDDNYLLQSQVVAGGGTGGSDLFRVVTCTPQDSGVLEFCEYDVGAGTWTAQTTIGGGFNTHTHVPLAFTDAAGVQRYKRPDGTEIVAYQCEYVAADGFRRVRILKNDSGTWTELAVYGNGSETDYYVLQTGIMAANGDVHLFINHATANFNTSEYLTSLLCHVSVAASNDAVSSLHTVDTDMEFMPATSNPGQPTWTTHNGRPAINSGSTEIAFGYGWQVNTQYNQDGSLQTAQELRVARGDMTSTPLAPSWTVDTIATDEPRYIGSSDDMSCTYEAVAKIAMDTFESPGGDLVRYGNHDTSTEHLKLYWADLLPYSRSGSRFGKLFWSERVSGSWSAPAQLWPDPDTSNQQLEGLDVASPLGPVQINVTVHFNMDYVDTPESPKIMTTPIPGPPGPVVNPTECINQE